MSTLNARGGQRAYVRCNRNNESLTASPNTPEASAATLVLPLVFLQPHQRLVTTQQEAPVLEQERKQSVGQPVPRGEKLNRTLGRVTVNPQHVLLCISDQAI